jgi:hypothetical protein
MLGNLVFVCALASALALPVSIEPTATAAARTFEFEHDAASFDPMVAYEEQGRQLEEEETEGRQLAEATKSTAAPKPKKVAGASGPGQMGISSLRYKLSQSYCPSADEAEKALLACQNHQLGVKVKGSKDEAAKKKIVEERKELYAAAAAKPDAEKKKAAADHKDMYSKAFSKYCVGAHSSSDVCTNEMMTKMYGGAKPTGAKKALKEKKA